MIAKVHGKIASINIPIHVAVDSKDLFSTFSTYLVPEEKFIRAEVQLISYNLKQRKVIK